MLLYKQLLNVGSAKLLTIGHHGLLDAPTKCTTVNQPIYQVLEKDTPYCGSLTPNAQMGAILSQQAGVTHAITSSVSSLLTPSHTQLPPRSQRQRGASHLCLGHW